MKWTVTKPILGLVLGPVVFSVATLSLSGPIAAESIENQCRLTVRPN